MRPSSGIRAPWAIGAAVALTAAVAGCSAGGAAAAAPPEKPSIVVGDFPTVDSAGLYIAQMDGLFAARGLNVKIAFTPTSQLAVAGQIRGEYDVSSADYVTYIEDDTAGQAKLRIVAAASTLQPGNLDLLRSPATGIRSPGQLAGSSIAVTAPDDIATLLIDELLRENGVPPSAAHFVTGIQLPDAGQYLGEDKADAAPVPEPFASEAEERYGLQPLADLDQGATRNFPVQGYAVTREWARKYPDTLAAFDGALKQGQDIADTNRAAVERALEKFLHIPAQTAAVIALPDYPLTADPVQLQRVADAMLQFGFLPGRNSSFNVKSMTG